MGLKIKYNSTKVDRSKSQMEPPPVGLYTMTIKEIKHHPATGDKEAALEFVVRVKDDGPHKGYGFWDWVSLGDASAWKVDQYLLAVGVDTIGKPKGTIDVDDFLNKDVKGRVKSDTWNGEYRPKLGAVLPLPDAEDDDLFDDDEEDETEEEEADETEEEEADEEDDEESDTDGDDEDSEVDLDEVGAAADEEDEEAIAALTELAGENDLDPDDYETWADLATALGELEDAEEEAPPAKKAAAKKAAPGPRAAKSKTVDYEAMDQDELKAECTKRGLPTKGAKSAIIARLRSNDNDPFSD